MVQLRGDCAASRGVPAGMGQHTVADMPAGVPPDLLLVPALGRLHGAECAQPQFLHFLAAELLHYYSGLLATPVLGVLATPVLGVVGRLGVGGHSGLALIRRCCSRFFWALGRSMVSRGGGCIPGTPILSSWVQHG